VSGLLSPVQVTGAEQDYSSEIHLRQDDVQVGGEPVCIAGKLQSTISILEYVEL